MPFFDWLELCGVRPSWFSGSVGVTIGDTLTGVFGARHSHIFGPEIKLVCDPEDLIMGRLESCLPTTAALLSGVGGNVTWVYGANTTATYVGPKMEIRRAESVNKTSDNIIAHKREGTGEDVKDTDEIDKAMAILVGALSAVMCLTAAALDLALHFKYQEMTDAKSDEDKEHYENVVEDLKVWSYTVTGRLMAILKLIEDKGTWAELGKAWTENAEKIAKKIASACEVIVIGTVVVILMTYYWWCIRRAIANSSNALTSS